MAIELNAETQRTQRNAEKDVYIRNGTVDSG